MFRLGSLLSRGEGEDSLSSREWGSRVSPKFLPVIKFLTCQHQNCRSRKQNNKAKKAEMKPDWPAIELCEKVSGVRSDGERERGKGFRGMTGISMGFRHLNRFHMRDQLPRSL